MAQSVKCLLCKYEDPSSDPRNPFKKPSMAQHSWDSSAGEAETGESLELAGLTHWLMGEFKISVRDSVSRACVRTHTHTHTCTHMNIVCTHMNIEKIMMSLPLKACP